MRNLTKVGLTGSCAMLVGAAVQAVSLLDVNFDNVSAKSYLDYTGSFVLDSTMVQPWNAAGGMTKMTAAYGSWSNPAVVNNTGGFPTHSLRGYWHYANTAPVFLTNDTHTAFTGTTTGQYAFSLDVSLPNANDYAAAGFSNIPGVYLLSNLGTKSFYGGANTANGQALLGITINAGNITATGGNGSLTLVSGATLNTPYTVKAVLDMAANTMALYTNGTLSGTLTQLEALDGHGIMGMGVEMGLGPWNSPWGTEGLTSYYDNFTLVSIPEPASLVLLALGGVAVLRRRRAA